MRIRYKDQPVNDIQETGLIATHSEYHTMAAHTSQQNGLPRRQFGNGACGRHTSS
jgi:hypothetical protein